MKKTHGGQRKNSGRLPLFGEKGEEKKSIQIKVPAKHHKELMEVCKKCISNYLKNLKNA